MISCNYTIRQIYQAHFCGNHVSTLRQNIRNMFFWGILSLWLRLESLIWRDRGQAQCTRQTFPKPSPDVIQELGQEAHKARPGCAGSQQVLVAVHQRWRRVRTDVGHPLRLQHARGCCRVLLPTHHNGPNVREFEVTAGKIVGVAECAVLEEAVQVLARAQAAGAGV